MRKSVLFVIAGAGLVLTGCNASNHRYQTIPVDNPDLTIQTPAAPAQYPAPQATYRAPAPEIINTPAATQPQAPAASQVRRQYAPMTGVVSSGGVDSVSSPRRSQPTASADAASAGGTHIVKRGENPATIARKYRVSLSALMAANNLNAESAKRLRIGQKLVIPGASGASASRSSAAATVQAADNSPAVGNGQHRIRQGETPEVIARRYRVKVKDLMAANNLTEESARRLQIGQVLNIPGKSGAAASAASSQSATGTPAATASTAKDQTSQAPAAAQSAALDPLLMETDLLDITENTTYAAVAARYGIPEATLRALNGGTTETAILKGGVILVPKK